CNFVLLSYQTVAIEIIYIGEKNAYVNCSEQMDPDLRNQKILYGYMPIADAKTVLARK
ncbi:hypothetical protein WUBG_18031, partial [Wuchereria bancrofti]